MSKALIIKGANFALNKVETIVISDPKPCAGISLSQNSINMASLGSTSTISATVMPNDTTDSVIWISSNENVATVSNGVVTAVGVGSATITASCGTHTATCTVAITDTIILNNAYSVFGGYKYSGSLDLKNGKNHVGFAVEAAAELFYDPNNTLNGYRASVTNTSTRELFADKYPMPIPQGTNTITVNVSPTVIAGASRIAIVIVNANEKQTYVGGQQDGSSALGLAAYVQNVAGGTVPLTADISSLDSPNGFIVSVTDNGSSTYENIGDVTVTFAA